jgi:ATP-dependent DNA helicase RecG
VTHGRLSDEARARVDVLTRSDDGFVIAEKDLELRGPGDFFGTRQSGCPILRVGDLLRDRDLLMLAREEAFRYVEQNRGRGLRVDRWRSCSSAAAGSAGSAWPASAEDKTGGHR